MEDDEPPVFASRPPSYRAAAGRDSSGPRQQDTTDRVPTSLCFDRTKHGIQILDTSSTNESRYYVGRFRVLDHPDVVLYRGGDTSGPVVGQATFDRVEKDFIIAFSDPKAASTSQEEIVSCISNQSFFGHDNYQFVVPSNEDSSEAGVQAPPSTKYTWRRTHNTSLGSSRWKSKDFKLVDDATGEVVAVYNHLSEAEDEMGKLEWKLPRSLGHETRALLVLTALFERTRRSKKQASRANVVGAPQGPGRGRNY